jgi:sulfur carrier protein ThiS
MRVTLKLYATLSDYLPPEARSTNQTELDISPDLTIGQIIERCRLPAQKVHLVLVNGVYVEREQRATRTLQEGDALAMWPPIAGG